MKDIGSLLEHIKQSQSKDESQTIVQAVYNTTGVHIDKKDVHISLLRDVRGVRFTVSGAKKTLLSIKKGVLQEKMKELGFTLL